MGPWWTRQLSGAEGQDDSLKDDDAPVFGLNEPAARRVTRSLTRKMSLIPEFFGAFSSSSDQEVKAEGATNVPEDTDVEHLEDNIEAGAATEGSDDDLVRYSSASMTLPSRGLHVVPLNRGLLEDCYEVSSKIEVQGSNFFVKLARRKGTRTRRAIKSVARMHKRSNPCQEIDVLNIVDHPNVIRMYEFFYTQTDVQLVLEYCTGSNLIDLCCSRREKHLQEKEAAFLAKQLLRGVAYLHSSFICHRDLKCEACLLASTETCVQANTLKIADLGSSCIFERGVKLRHHIDASSTNAPELRIHPPCYDESCDLWSCGIIICFLLCGKRPSCSEEEAVRDPLAPGAGGCREQGLDTYGEDVKSSAGVVQRGGREASAAAALDSREHAALPFGMEGDGCKLAPAISREAMSLARELLRYDPSLRIAAKQALQHSWLNLGSSKETDIQLNMKLFENLCSFQALNKFKKAALRVIVSLLPESQVRGPRDIFMLVDSGSWDGVSVEHLRQCLKQLVQGLGYEQLSRESKKRFKALRKAFDIAFEGVESITYTEFLAATFNRKVYVKEPVCKAAFAVFDKDGDGGITRAELSDGKLLGQLSSQEISKLLCDIDMDGDGKIDFQEFMAMMSNEF